MQPYFVWRGVDSRDVGLLISQLPDIVRPAERVESVTILGRAGSLQIAEDDAVYDSYVKKCVVTVMPNADYRVVLQWLTGAGQVIFSNEPERVYDAQIISQIDYTRLHVGTGLRQGSVEFLVQPFKHRFPVPNQLIAATQDGTITNIGDVRIFPKLYVRGMGAGVVTINGANILVDGYTGGYGWTIDGATKTAYNAAGESVMSRITGDFPVFNVGENPITWDNAIDGVSYLPDWLYL